MITPGVSLVDTILAAINNQKLQIDNGDLIAIASKVVAVTERRLKKLNSTKPSQKAKKLARQYGLDPSFAEMVLQESDSIYGGVSQALLTLKHGVFTANAGVDCKNAPKGQVALWPRNAQKSAQKIRKQVLKRTGKNVGVLIVDSMVHPCRVGTSGVALGIAGFDPIKDYRCDKDLYGNSISITRHAVADDLAAAAHFLMGESTERTPIVLIKTALLKLSEEADSESIIMPMENCLFGSLLPKGSMIKSR